MWRTHRDPRISEVEAWLPESEHAESRARGLAKADHIDERLMKFGNKESFSSPYKGRGLSDFSMQDDELNREFWLRRESQNQSLASSRKLSRSVNGGSNDLGGYHFERNSSVPRSGSSFSREEDLYSSQEMLPIHKDYSRTQTEVRTQRRVPHLNEELYPVTNTMINHRPVAPYNQGYAANTWALRKGMESHRAAFEGAMMSYAPNYSNPQMQNFQYDGRYTGSTAYYPMHSYADPYDNLHAPFDVRNGQISLNGAYTFPRPLQQLTGSPLATQREMSTCTCCKEHACIQPPFHSHSSFRPYPPTAYSRSGYQLRQGHACVQDHISSGKFSSSSSSQKSLNNLYSRRKAVDPLAQAVLARKQNCPPVPGSRAPPYVLCQGCDKVVHIPTPILVENAVLKVRCGACRRISKFCNIVHPCYQALVKEGRASSQADRTNSLIKQKLFSTAGKDGIAEQDSAAQEAMAAKLSEEYKSSCVVKGEHDEGEKQIEIKGIGILDGEQDLESYTPSMLLQQGPGEGEWRDANNFRPWSRSGTSHGDSSSFFTASGAISIKATAGQKSYESQQIETHVEYVTQCTLLEEGVQAKAPTIAADSAHEQSDKRLKAPSEELQGLMLECLQESSYEDSKGKKKDGTQEQGNQSQQDKHDEVMCLSNEDSQRAASLSPTSEQTHETFLAPKEQIECSNLQSRQGQAKVSNDVAHSSPSCPSPGSPLYKYLSYDNASEIVQAVKNGVEGKQAVGATHVRDTSKGSNFLTSFLKKNTPLGNAGQGFNRSLSVVVNGTLIPFDAVKSAEKQAGAIRPGVYWYDYEAGFWGVMGGPCLGIIPPFIAEFKLPLAKDCAGGTTGILINGRELHKKDLDALAGRGLPRTPGKSYMVDISGQVVDNSSGQMLRSLGRLAPTVQKRGRGCGMFQPPTLH